ncbi:hypothetical protein [Coleofasciculus sp. G2-EDA-02]|uniref:hypothetical protein n=1 Tax=Coleofasciculus sp. G2-EDA-02 TaxID=3069529 RepID=UPI0040631DF0
MSAIQPKFRIDNSLTLLCQKSPLIKDAPGHVWNMASPASLVSPRSQQPKTF